MEKFLPYEKPSKKEKRKIDLAKRQTCGELNPVTRKLQNSKAYNRNKSRNLKRDYHETNSGTFLLSFLQICDDYSLNFRKKKVPKKGVVAKGLGLWYDSHIYH
jgi:hypothetical protein